MTRVGIVGVGVMGAPIARNILKGGFSCRRRRPYPLASPNVIKGSRVARAP